MKNLIKLGCALVGVALVSAGCQNDKPAPTPPEGEKAVIKVGIAAVPASRSQITDNAAVTAFENAIFSFDAYVFDWTTGFLEASGSSPDGQPITIPDVNTAGSKRVVVIANGTGISSVPSLAQWGHPLAHYDDLATGSIGFGNQIVSDTEIANPTRGLLMTGENYNPVTLYAGNENLVNVPVKRVVSKVRLGNITFADNVTLADLKLFDITDAGIQKALGATTIGTGAITPLTNPAPYYYAAFDNPLTTDPVLPELIDNNIGLADFITSLVTALAPSDLNMTLSDAIAAAPGFNTALRTKAINAFWYVLPNNGVGTTPTMLTLKGSWNGVDFYYPAEINSPDRNPAGSSMGAGVYMERNTVYTLNIEFLDLVGSPDPDTPGKMVSMKVTITPEQWAGPVIQNTVW